MGAFGSWDPLNNYVQGGLLDGRFVSGGLTLLAAGPPRLSQMGGVGALASEAAAGSDSDIVFPIGCIQNANHSQNKTFMRVWELGSDRSYFVGGRVVGQLGLSRIYYHGPSLLRILMGYYQDQQGLFDLPWLFANEAAQSMPNPHNVVVPPGYDNLFLNLASDLFNQPLGILMYMRDSNLDTIGAQYFEAVQIPQHTWSTDAQGTIVQEQATLQYERAVPVSVGGISLVTGFSLSAGVSAGLSLSL